MFKNCKLVNKNVKYLRLFNRDQYLHFQSTFTNVNIQTESTNAITAAKSNQEWAEAKHFEEIPSLGTIKQLWHHLPGGKYSQLDLIQLLKAMTHDLGTIFKIKGYLGQPETVFTINPDDFGKVFRNEGPWPARPSFGGIQHYRNVHRRNFFQGVTGLLGSQGQQWGTFRSAVNPVLLQPKHVAMYLNKMSQVNKEFLQRTHEIRDPRTFEVPATFEEEISRWALESIALVAVDKQLGLIRTNRNNAEALELFNHFIDFNTNAIDMALKPPILKIINKKSFNKLMTSLDGITDIIVKYIEETFRKVEKNLCNGLPQKPEGEESILEKLLKIDKKVATLMALDLITGGVDTTSSSFTGLLLCLAKSPEKQNILREELFKVLPSKDSQFDESSFKKTPYLRACLKEALRIYPLISGITRRPVNDIVLSGYRVPKGTQISLVNIFMLADNTYFSRAKEFLPERWLRSPISECPRLMQNGNPFINIPFSFGPRSCVGRRIAEQEIKLAAAYLVRNFHIEFNHPIENAFKCHLFQVPNIPLRFKFTDVKH